MAQAAEHAIGIDFGTSTSLLAERNGLSRAGIVPLGHSTNSLPSLAAIDSGRLLVGEEADNLHPEQIIRSVKRTITERRDHVEVTTDEGTHRVEADEVIVALLREIGARAEAAERPLRSGDEIRLGCPAMWDGEQRHRLLALADRAGLPVAASSLVDEPIAAGIAWVTHRYFQDHTPKGRLLVFDMGGGTLDIAVLDVEGGAAPKISVLSAVGVDRAGDALDRAIADDLLRELADNGFDTAIHPQGRALEATILREARVAKERLSWQDRHQILVRGGARLGIPTLTYERARLEELFRPQMQSAEYLVWAALRAAKLTESGSSSPETLRAQGEEELRKEVGYVLLAGGMSRIPYVERRIGELLPNARVYDNAGVEVEEAIVAGLADTTAYGRLNLHRPGFDFVLEYTEGGRRCVETVYPAYTPFYEPWEAASKAMVGFECSGDRFPGPGRGTGVLRVRSTSGEYLALRCGDQEMDGFQLQLGPGMIFKIYPNGELVVRDAARRKMKLRVTGWPIIRGSNYARLFMEKMVSRNSSPPLAWHQREDYMPPQMR